MSFVMKLVDPETVAAGMLIEFARRVQCALYRDDRTGRFDPEKEWDADTTSAVADALRECGFVTGE